MKKAFQDTLHGLGEVNSTHAYYNGFCTSKDTEDLSWSTSFKTKRTHKTTSALEVLWKTLFLLHLYMIGTLLWFKFGFGPLCGLLDIVRGFGIDCDLGHHSRLFEVKAEDAPEDAVETMAKTIKTKSNTFRIFEDGKKVGRTTELRKPEEVIE
ncbi:hypothetical protein Tco_0422865 [Tanacetum coccineum]